jgi:HTH-type transcriptional regulator, competence development regulator
MTFGERVKELRKARGVSQRELARRVGIDFTYLSKIENDRMEPPSEVTIRRIAEALDASADDLLVWADRFPSDLADDLKDSETIGALRRSLAGDFDSFEDVKRALSKRARRKR